MDESVSISNFSIDFVTVFTRSPSQTKTEVKLSPRALEPSQESLDSTKIGTDHHDPPPLLFPFPLARDSHSYPKKTAELTEDLKEVKRQMQVHATRSCDLEAEIEILQEGNSLPSPSQDFSTDDAKRTCVKTTEIEEMRGRDSKETTDKQSLVSPRRARALSLSKQLNEARDSIEGLRRNLSEKEKMIRELQVYNVQNIPITKENNDSNVSSDSNSPFQRRSSDADNVGSPRLRGGESKESIERRFNLEKGMWQSEFSRLSDELDHAKKILKEREMEMKRMEEDVQKKTEERENKWKEEKRVMEEKMKRLEDENESMRSKLKGTKS